MKIVITMPIFNIPIHLCDNFDEQKHPVYHSAGAIGHVWIGENNHIYFTFTRCDKFGGSVLAHECLHIVNRAFQIVGAKHDEYNDEAAAYFLTWVYRNVFDFVFLEGKYKKLQKKNAK